MTVGEIIADADERIPNTISESRKISWLNEIQQQLFRKVNFPPQVEKLTAIAGQVLYPLPDYCPADRIKRVVVIAAGVSTEYVYKPFDDVVKGSFYYLINDSIIGLYPVPIGGEEVLIYFSKRPSSLSSSSVPELPKEYHEIFTVALCARIAKVQRDVELANNYSADYEEILGFMMRDYGANLDVGAELEKVNNKFNQR